VSPSTKVLHARGVDLVEGRTDPHSIPPIGSEHLRPEAGSETRGLKGEYFQGRDLEGTPVLTRVDPEVDFRWFRGGPTDELVSRGELPGESAVGGDDYSVRWTGRLLPPVTGSYELTVTANDAARLLVDGRVVLEDWVESATVRTLRGKGLDPEQIVAIEQSAAGRARASADGIAVVAGNAARQEVLKEAGAESAAALIVAPDRDDTAVLIALTARELNPEATIVASVREEENVHLLHQSGADAVITSSGAAGRLLGLSTQTPQVTEVMEDLLTVGEGLDIAEREVGAGEAGPSPSRTTAGIMLAVVRDGEVIRFDDDRAAELREGDRVLVVQEGRSASMISGRPESPLDAAIVAVVDRVELA